MSYIGRRGPKVATAFGRWLYNSAGFNQYGLYHDDVLYETPEVKEAIRRLPQHLYDERNFRMIRALQLSMTKTILPKDQWTKYEEDYRYLEPYLEEVKKEFDERTMWNTK